MRRAVVTAALVSLFAAMAGCGASAAELGKNLAGETCRSDGALVLDRSQAILCGDTAQGSDAGQVSYLMAPKDPAGLHTALARAVQPRQDLNCDDVQWIGANTALRICSLKSNGWPRIVLGVAAGGKVYRSDVAPSSVTVAQTMIAADSKEPASNSKAILAAIESKLSPGMIRSSASDYGSYQKYIEAARLAGAADNYAAAESNYRHALGIEEKLFGLKSEVVGQTVAELALQVSNQGRFADAAALFRRAAPLIEASSVESVRARYDSYLALDAANQRRYADALKYARQATQARRAEIEAAKQSNAALGEGIDPVPVSQGELAHALRIESEMALRLGDLASAQATAEEALWIVSDEPGLPLWWRADTIALLGEINERRGRVVAAEKDMRDARDLNLKLFGETAPTAFSDLQLGAFYCRQQLYTAALEAYHKAIAVAARDSVARGELSTDDIVQYATAELASGDPATRDAKIFAASQLVNTSVADRTIARVAARQAAGNDALSALIVQAQSAEHRRDLARMQLATEYTKPDSERNPEREQGLANDIKQASAEADGLMEKVRQSFPDYAKLADPGAADLAAVQAQLAQNEALISFVFGQTDGYALVVRRSGFDAVKLAIGKEQLADDVSDLRSALIPAAGHLPEFSLKNSYTLYQSLIGPLESKLEGVDHLVVVPSASLSSLPLALLVTETPANQDYQSAAWLVKRYAVSNVPSPRSFLTLTSETHRPTVLRSFLGIGAPDFKGTAGPDGDKALAALNASCRDAGPASADLLRALPPLPGTAHEVQTVGAKLAGNNADVLIGVQATESRFRAQPLDQFSVIYFATHGVLPGELHCESEPALALSPPQTQATATADDGMLQASEIAQLKLNADLVVLSACNTAESGDTLGGGALQGLSDAFFAAGARSVLASHWEVPSNATETLMIGLFDASNAADLAQGLRRSQLHLIAQASTAHPFYWAAFTIIGDDRSAGQNASVAQNAGQP
ncbi:MAG TPA: CHAT domain-containing protein [Rhizomicrobium sp.]|nr:CHAT domain-containing protein [Rhizomicrobium sp.]